MNLWMNDEMLLLVLPRTQYPSECSLLHVASYLSPVHTLKWISPLFFVGEMGLFGMRTICNDYLVNKQNILNVPNIQIIPVNYYFFPRQNCCRF